MEACPFCSGKAFPEPPSLGRSHWNVVCDDCGASGPHGHDEAQSVRRWNDLAMKAKEPVVIDLEQTFWQSICEAAAQSNWIPPEYFMNDWVSDCCDFLRNGPAKELPLETVERVNVPGCNTTAKLRGDVVVRVALAINEARFGYEAGIDWEPSGRELDAARAAIASMGDDGLREALLACRAYFETREGATGMKHNAMLKIIDEALARTSLGTDGGGL